MDIISSFKSLTQTNEADIKNFFLTCLKQPDQEKALYDLLEAVISDDSLKSYAKLNYMNPFWDNQLEHFKVDSTGFRVRKEENISSLYLLIGFYIDIKITNQYSEGMEELIRRGIYDYSSYHCLEFKLTQLVDQFDLKPSYDLMKEIIDLACEGFKLSAPGYLLNAHICWILSKYDPKLLCKIPTYLKRAMEFSSAEDQLHNAFYGQGKRMHDIHIQRPEDIGTLLSKFFIHYPMVQEQEFVTTIRPGCR